MRKLGCLAVIGLLAVSIIGCSTIDPAPSETVNQDSELAASLSSKWDLVSAQFPDAVRPEVEVVRRIDIADWALTVTPCLTDLGFTAIVLPDGGIQFPAVPEDQLEPRAIADYTCQAKFPPKAKYLAPLSAEQIEHIYNYFVGELSVCLEREGHPVNKHPSLQNFLDEYETPNSWNPYVEAMAGVGQDEYYRVVAKCPQFPNDLYG